MPLPDGNPRIPEGINARNEHPLREFALLAAGVGAAVIVGVFALALSARLLAPFIPFDWEVRATPAVSSLLQGNGAQAGAAALDTLARDILDSSLAIPVNGEPAADAVPPDCFSFTLLDHELPNAFATLGAHVAVTEGLLDHVQSENGLAMVIAHEIAHVQLRHPIEAASRGVLVQIALGAVLGNSGNNLLGGSLGSGGLLTLLSFNRDMELEADRRALAILRAHYGHVAGAEEFFLAVADGAGSEWLEFTQTHPNPARRLAVIREAMAGNPRGASTRALPSALARSP